MRFILRTLILSLTLLSLWPIGTHAFYSKTDATESYTIKPSQTAIWILDTEDSPNNQVEANSFGYLESHQIQLRTIQIPHYKLSGSAGRSVFTWWDYYVPVGRLVLIDRAPVGRTWISEPGVVRADPSLSCLTRDGLRVSVGVSITASISETQSAQYLYFFGLEMPEGDPNQPELIFKSVYHARSLEYALDNFGHALIHTLFCREVVGRTLDEVNAQYPEIVNRLKDSVARELNRYGITVDNISLADRLRLDPPVQQAINRLYISKKEAVVAETVSQSIQVLNDLAAVSGLRSFGSATRGLLPKTLMTFMPPVILDLLVPGPSSLEK